MAAEHRLDLGGEDRHAADLEHFLAPAEELQQPPLVDHADVAGVQPAVAERLDGRIRLVPVGLQG